MDVLHDAICFNFPIDRNKDRIIKYFEFNNNGFIEYGTSMGIGNIFSEGGKLLLKYLRLTNLINILAILIQFAKEYYKKINYFEEIFVQLSLVNVNGFALGGFSYSTEATPIQKMKEPFERFNRRPPLSQVNNFKEITRFFINDLNRNKIKDIAYYFAEKISNHFGLMEINYYFKN